MSRLSVVNGVGLEPREFSVLIIFIFVLAQERNIRIICELRDCKFIILHEGYCACF